MTTDDFTQAFLGLVEQQSVTVLPDANTFVQIGLANNRLASSMMQDPKLKSRVAKVVFEASTFVSVDVRELAAIFLMAVSLASNDPLDIAELETQLRAPALKLASKFSEKSKADTEQTWPWDQPSVDFGEEWKSLFTKVGAALPR